MPYIGEIRIFAGTFAPINWAFCDGSIIPVSKNSALFAVIGKTYGGDGTTTFALPDLRGRIPIHAGSLMGNNYVAGQILGSEQETILPNQLPAHTHNITGDVYQPVLGENPGQQSSPDNNYMAITKGQQVYSTAKLGSNRMGPLKVSMQLQNTGGGQPIDNVQPYLPLNFIICLYGEFPQRQ